MPSGTVGAGDEVVLLDTIAAPSRAIAVRGEMAVRQKGVPQTKPLQERPDGGCERLAHLVAVSVARIDDDNRHAGTSQLKRHSRACRSGADDCHVGAHD